MEKRAQRRWAARKSGLNLTQVPSHQIGIVEILHAQSNDVDEFLYDLHELHCSGIYLDKIKKKKDTFDFNAAAMTSQMQQWSVSTEGWKCGAYNQNEKQIKKVINTYWKASSGI